MNTRAIGVLIFLLVCSQQSLAGDLEVKKKLMKTTVTLDLKKAPLEEVVRTLSKASGVPILVDPKIYRTYPAAQLQVTMKAAKLSVWSCLQLVVDMTSLELAIVKGLVRVGDRSSAPKGVVARRYYVGDLMIVIRDFPGTRLGLSEAYPERPYTGRSLYRERPLETVRQAPRLGFSSGRGGFPSVRLDRPFGDRSYVPLGTPHYGSDQFSRPIYRDRRQGPHQAPGPHAGGLSNPAVLIARLQAMTGGETVWSRPGVSMRLTRGGQLHVVHTPAVVLRVAAAVARLRSGKKK